MKHKIDDSYANIDRVIDNYIIGFKAYRNKQILKSRYLHGHTFEEIAEMYDMSVRQIKKICYDYEPIIISKLRVED